MYKGYRGVYRVAKYYLYPQAFFNPVTYASSGHRHIWAIIIVNFEVLGCRVLARHYDSG